MKKSIVAIVLLVLSFSLPAQAKLFAVGTPTRAIQDLDKLLETYIVSPKTDEEKAYNRQLKKKALHGTFDIRTLAKVSLAKHWSDRTPKEQDYFVDVLSQLLERKAVFAKEQGGKKKQGSSYRITYQGHKFLKGTKQKARVSSWIRIPGENLKISLNYKLHEVEAAQKRPLDPLFSKLLPVPSNWPVGKEWKIYDVIVDEASLLDNYRYQFDSIIRKGGYADLIRRMESKLAQMKDKETKATT